MDWIVAPFRKFAEFGGRATRREFFAFTAIFAIATIAANRFDAMDGKRVAVAAGMGVAELVVFVLLVLPFVAVGSRRLHDTGRAAWWMMLLYIPYIASIAARGQAALELVCASALVVGALVLFIQFVLPGQQGENRYGPDPRGVGTAL